MTKKRIIILSLIALILAVLIFIFVQYKKLYDAPWDFAGGRIDTFNFSKISVVVFFKVRNNGLAGTHVSGQEYDVLINDRFLSKIKNYNKVYIAPDSNSYLPFLIEMKTQDLIKVGFSNIQDILNDKSKVVIKIKGQLAFNIFEFIPIKYKEFEEVMTLEEVLSKKTT